mmetsp:Transcript_8570/g.35849  ORF Transcript_8570/g.35849 Transcript_8570/m.35849 type:complete len:590 (-) Transcript_8570:81-1850(-)
MSEPRSLYTRSRSCRARARHERRRRGIQRRRVSVVIRPRRPRLKSAPAGSRARRLRLFLFLFPLRLLLERGSPRGRRREHRLELLVRAALVQHGQRADSQALAHDLAQAVSRQRKHYGRSVSPRLFDDRRHHVVQPALQPHLLDVRRHHHSLGLLELHSLRHLAQPENQAPAHLSLHRVLVVRAVLEPLQLGHARHGRGVGLRGDDLVGVPNLGVGADEGVRVALLLLVSPRVAEGPAVGFSLALALAPPLVLGVRLALQVVRPRVVAGARHAARLAQARRALLPRAVAGRARRLRLPLLLLGLVGGAARLRIRCLRAEKRVLEPAGDGPGVRGERHGARLGVRVGGGFRLGAIGNVRRRRRRGGFVVRILRLVDRRFLLVRLLLRALLPVVRLVLFIVVVVVLVLEVDQVHADAARVAALRLRPVEQEVHVHASDLDGHLDFPVVRFVPPALGFAAVRLGSLARLFLRPGLFARGARREDDALELGRPFLLLRALAFLPAAHHHARGHRLVGVDHHLALALGPRRARRRRPPVRLGRLGLLDVRAEARRERRDPVAAPRLLEDLPELNRHAVGLGFLRPVPRERTPRR